VALGGGEGGGTSDGGADCGAGDGVLLVMFRKVI
jgi:hypothetical protein